MQTLHHYDRIGLLVPSIRQANGYRLYSEKDLLRLQQIIALKYFGFSLTQIKSLLSTDVNMIEQFTIQSRFLTAKAEALMEASQTLNNIVANCRPEQSIPWESIIQLIEVYRMTEQLEHNWVKEIFTNEELKQYAAFEAELKANSTPEQQATFENNWQQLVTDIQNNLDKDPNSDIGNQLGKRCMDLINALYGKKYAHLRTKKFERGFAEGKGLDEVGLTPEMVTWLDGAIDTYWHRKIYALFKQIDKISSKELKQQWHAILDEMYGEGQDERKPNLIAQILNDSNISPKAKEWLKAVK